MGVEIKAALYKEIKGQVTTWRRARSEKRGPFSRTKTNQNAIVESKERMGRVSTRSSQ